MITSQTITFAQGGIAGKADISYTALTKVESLESGTDLRYIQDFRA